MFSVKDAVVFCKVCTEKNKTLIPQHYYKIFFLST